MRILSVDTCLRAGGVASLNRGAVVASVFSRSEDPYSSRLFNDLAVLQAKTGLSVADYDLYAVGNGPGSFTGVRVGITAVKAWAELYRKPIVTVSTLQAVAYEARAVESHVVEAGGLVCAVIDARRGQVFGGVYRIREGRPSRADINESRDSRRDRYSATAAGASTAFSLKTLYEGVSTIPELFAEVERLANSADAKSADKRAGWESARVNSASASSARTSSPREDSAKVEFISPSPGIIRSAVETSRFGGARIMEATDDLAPWVGRAGYEKYLAGEITDVLELDANYIRRCDAEVYWKGA